MNAVTEQKPKSPAEQFRGQLQNLGSEIGNALPPHIPVERFMRVVLTAVNGNSDLLGADRRSLFEAAMKAAQDGLLPDGRDGAFVIFKNRVQWMPMVGGILKKVRNSGELLSIAAYVVHEKDRFTYRLGDDESIEHEPCLDDDRGKPKIVYAVAKTKDGGIYREVMTVADVEKVRAVSRARNSGPWVEWWNEMARKTVIRRLAKRLPMSTDLDDLIRRDDELYDFSGQRQEPQPTGLRERLTAARTAPPSEGFTVAHGNAVEAEVVEVDPDTGEVLDAATQAAIEPETAIDDRGFADGYDDADNIREPDDDVMPTTLERLALRLETAATDEEVTNIAREMTPDLKALPIEEQAQARKKIADARKAIGGGNG
jgi:recombination protein RecT